MRGLPGSHALHLRRGPQEESRCLSGGEKGALHALALMLQDPNVLLLDGPPTISISNRSRRSTMVS